MDLALVLALLLNLATARTAWRFHRRQAEAFTVRHWPEDLELAIPGMDTARAA